MQCGNREKRATQEELSKIITHYSIKSRVLHTNEKISRDAAAACRLHQQTYGNWSWRVIPCPNEANTARQPITARAVNVMERSRRLQVRHSAAVLNYNTASPFPPADASPFPTPRGKQKEAIISGYFKIHLEIRTIPLRTSSRGRLYYSYNDS